MSALNTDLLPLEEKLLFTPSLDEIRLFLLDGLKSNFSEVNVDVVECPDLREAPYHLACEGLNGSAALCEVGGPPYLLPTVDREKIYDLREISRKILNSSDEIFSIGAGAGYFPYLNSNCEGIYNMKIDKNNSTSGSSSYFVSKKSSKECNVVTVPCDETRFALLANIFLSEGKPGKVVRVHCKQRIGSDDFITSIRKTLAGMYGDKTIGLGGVFLLKNGKVKQHVMSEFSETPITTEEQLNSWMNYYEMPAPLINLGTLVTNEADLDLRLQHFHSFSKGVWGGHYHYDTTPHIVEYEGFFNVGEKIVRIDKPIHTHQFGRD
ncbi:Ester hydrolase C11orf54 like [Pseudolycoriella hygida]|uniref:Ester hydrolase C11orf54 like n=1 Tax=Pseudolycoriella hygida TaxID=35572 RepID=A0A9Q0MMQ4_9DIPT|nr:Ester hydrolase C11orf54 like [Pseudolycoriella hygida]